MTKSLSYWMTSFMQSHGRRLHQPKHTQSNHWSIHPSIHVTDGDYLYNTTHYVPKCYKKALKYAHKCTISEMFAWRNQSKSEHKIVQYSVTFYNNTILSTLYLQSVNSQCWAIFLIHPNSVTFNYKCEITVILMFSIHNKHHENAQLMHTNALQTAP